jgi:mannose-1-phosphate guanylyltransferase
MVVLPADHIIGPVSSFISAVKFACGIAGDDQTLVTFGIKPSRADTGYGYIELGRRLESNGSINSYQVKRFREKPSAQQTQGYLKAGNFMWNSGMFVWSVKAILDNFRMYMPALERGLQKYMKSAKSSASGRALDTFYKNVENQSINYCIMQKSGKIAAVVGGFFWDDVGSWQALPRILGSDKESNISVGDTVLRDCNKTIVINKNRDVTVTVFGAKNLTVVQSKDALLVADNSRIPDIKGFVGEVKKKKPGLT